MFSSKGMKAKGDCIETPCRNLRHLRVLVDRLRIQQVSWFSRKTVATADSVEWVLRSFFRTEHQPAGWDPMVDSIQWREDKSGKWKFYLKGGELLRIIAHSKLERPELTGVNDYKSLRDLNEESLCNRSTWQKWHPVLWDKRPQHKRKGTCVLNSTRSQRQKFSKQH